MLYLMFFIRFPLPWYGHRAHTHTHYEKKKSSKSVIPAHPNDAEGKVIVHQLDNELATNVSIRPLSNILLQSTHLNDCPTPRPKHFLAIIEPRVFPLAVLI